MPHTDDTPVPVQGKDRNKTRPGRVWVYVGDKNHPLTVFDYTPSRSRNGPVAFLDGFEGYLQALETSNRMSARKGKLRVACSL